MFEKKYFFSSAKLYIFKKERLQKKLVKGIKIFLEKRKTKGHNMVQKDINYKKLFL